MAGRSSGSTNWRVIAAFLLLALASALGLALNVRSSVTTNNITRAIRGRGAPCVAVRLPDGASFPSQGCERLARLLSQTCTLNPALCNGVAKAPRVSRRALARAVAKELSRQRRIAARQRRRQAAARQRHPRPPVTVPLPRPRGQSTTPSQQLPPRPAPPGPAPPAPRPPRPTPSGVVNNTGQRLTDTLNDATDLLGAGRPVPSPPKVPSLPPPVCPHPPLC